MAIRTAERLSHLPVYLFDKLDAAKAEVEATGVDVIDLSVGDPDKPSPDYVVDTLRETALDDSNHHYPSFKGLPEYRRAVAHWYRKTFNVNLDPDTEVLSVIGTKGGMSALPLALVNPGDPVLLPDPCYPAYIPGIIMAAGKVESMRLLPEKKFLPDLSEIPSDVAKAAPLMVLNFPGNPTAALGPLSFFEEVVAFANEHDIVVVHDAPYSEAVYDGERQPSFLEAPGAKEVGIEFHSLSKSFNMPGWRIGHAVGHREVIAALGRVKSNLDMGVFPPIQHAAISALTGSDAFTKARRDEYEQRRNVLCDGLGSLGWKVNRPPATFFVWTPVPDGSGDSSVFADRVLREAGVLITPGLGFGEGGEGYIRIALTVEVDVCRQVVERLEKAGLKF